MKAAVITQFGHPPVYEEFQDPIANDGEEIVAMSAVGLSWLIKGQAAGSHYSSASTLPMVPGNDGIGTSSSGRRVYFIGPRSPFGSIAERSVAATRDLIDVPTGLDDVTAAAIANPGMSSWGALSHRAKLVAGETVLIHGATGVAGQMAIQIAKVLGAKRVIAAGRNPDVLQTLTALGADECVSLMGTDEEVVGRFKKVLASGVDVVLDYLWGKPTELLLHAFIGSGGVQAEARVRFVEIGGAAGATLQLNGAVLRASGLELMGSGLGSVSRAGLLTSIAGLFDAAAAGNITVETETHPLTQVEQVWNLDAGTRRIVIKIA